MAWYKGKSATLCYHICLGMCLVVFKLPSQTFAALKDGFDKQLEENLSYEE